MSSFFKPLIFFEIDLPSTWEGRLDVHKEIVVAEGSEEWNKCVRAFKSTLSNSARWSVIEVSIADL